MAKTPEQYLQEHVILPEDGGAGQKFSDSEKIFLQKYMGINSADLCKKIGLDAPVTPDSIPLPGLGRKDADVKSEEWDVEAKLKQEALLQLVSFFVDGQEYALPIHVIQEVLRWIEPTRLPQAPAFIAGIVNLRGRVTPLIRLRLLLGAGRTQEEERFIVVCKHRGLQVGLIIQAVATMYRVPQNDIEWGIESQLGIVREFLSGVIKTAKSGKKLTGIISIERVVDRVLKG